MTTEHAGTDAPLFWTGAPLDPTAVAAARRYAFVDGRVLERDGSAVYAWGTAARLELPLGLDDGEGVRAVQRQLSAIRPLGGAGADGSGAALSDAALSGPAGGGPLALGALAFDPGGWSELVVPEIAVVADGDRHYAVAAGSAARLTELQAAFPFAPGATPPEPSGSEPPADSFTLASARPHEDFRARVAQAVETIRAGRLEKVVLAREVAVTANRPIRQHHLLERLRALHPSCCTFAVDGFVGASPELLVRRRGTAVVAQPLAGTVARSGDPEEDRHLAATLMASEKERSEHRIVVDAIVAALRPLCATVEAPEVPHLLELRNVAHLATRVTGSLGDGALGEGGAGGDGAAGGTKPSALDLLAALHPTPAVGGWPREAALEYLRKHEELDRGRYAGPVGWIRADGDGEWWIGIRCALLDGNAARLIAGVGIVADSEPASELAETQLKLQALLAAAVRP